MTSRIHEIVQKLASHALDELHHVTEQLTEIKDFTPEEKRDLFEALAAAFCRFQESDSITMLKLAIQTEKQLAHFGADVVPFLFHEIVQVDGESAAYLGKALAKIGPPGLTYILHQWEHYQADEHALINLLQTFSYYKLSELEAAIPLIIQATKREHYHITAMALQTLARLVEKAKHTTIEPSLVKRLYTVAYGFVAAVQPLVRKNAVRTLGQLVRGGFLATAEKQKVSSLFLTLTGKDEHHNWDRAFIVRQEAEHFMKYMTKGVRNSQTYQQSFRILAKRELCDRTFHFILEAPFIARKIEAGQFLIIRPHETSERIPLSVCGWHREAGTVHIIVSAVGKTSTEINRMQEGDTFKDVVGPLGERSHLPHLPGTCVVIGGGYGTGAIIPTARDMKAKGHKVIGIVGARTAESLIMIGELKSVCDEVLLTTNDGSTGLKGLVTDALREILSTEKVVHVLAVGPVPMMKAVCEMTRPSNIETFVSLNAIMVDGTGMCGACRVSVGKETKFACFHGPDFNGHQVDFENLMKRQKMFVNEERAAFATLSTT